jgi:hypothetical protein
VLLIETRDAAGGKGFRAPTCRCDECDGPMDFDDMEESYFAFLANTKKIVTDARVDSVINEFTPTDGDRKIRPRSSGGTNPGSKSGGSSAGGSSAGGSLPSIPSLPNIKQTVGGTGTGPGLSSVSGINGFGGGSSASGVRSSAAAALAELEARRAQTAPVPKEPGKANALWYAVVAILVVAVGVLGFVLFGGKH